MNYKVEQIVKNILIVDDLEFSVDDKVKIYTYNGDIFVCLITELYEDYMEICNINFGHFTVSYSDIKNIMLIGK